MARDRSAESSSSRMVGRWWTIDVEGIKQASKQVNSPIDSLLTISFGFMGPFHRSHGGVLSARKGCL